MIYQTNRTIKPNNGFTAFVGIRGIRVLVSESLSGNISNAQSVNFKLRIYKSFSSKPSFKRKIRTPSTRLRVSEDKNQVKRTWPYGSPSAGYIGKTNLGLIPEYFNDLCEKFSLDPHVLLDKTIKAHDKYIYNHGISAGTAKWKSIILYANGMLEGRSPENPGWVSTGREDKWPTKLAHLRPLFHYVIDNANKPSKVETVARTRQFLNTLFKVNRVAMGNSTIDVSEIIKKHKIDPAIVAGFEKYVRSRLCEIRESITITKFEFRLFLGPKNGPNGAPKAETALKEAAALVRDVELWPHFKEICYLTGNGGFLSFVEQCATEVSGESDPKDKILLRKITSIPDKANKPRIVAMCDFWSQSALASFEENIINVTMQLFSENCAFNSHTEGWNKIMSLPPEIHSQLVSLDASNWTDHFPASLQHIVVKVLYGQDVANAWYGLAVKCPWIIPGYNHPVRYGKGQGMGTKGSFAIAQLTDLLFIEWIMKTTYGEDSSNFYLKVGDDLVIQDPNGAMQHWYGKIGVEINDAKSKYFTKLGSFVEFVSRNSWNNQDYSIISPKLISRFMRNSHYALTLTNHVNERANNRITLNDIFDLKERYFLKKKPNFDSSKYRTHVNATLKCVTLMDWSYGKSAFTEDWYDWQGFDSDKIIDVVRDLTLITLANLVYKTTMLFKDRDALISKEKTKILLSRASFRSSWNNLFDWVSQQKLSLKEVMLLQNAVHFMELQNSKYEKGVKQPTPEFKVFETKQDSLVSPNPAYIKFLLDMQAQTDEMSLAYKVYKRYSMFDQANTAAVVHLHRFLNDALHREEIPLDIETGKYRLPFVDDKSKDRYVELDLQQLKIFSSHFGFDGFLSQIESQRLRTGEIKVLPFNNSILQT